jgi:hypothetical protein
VLIGQRSKTRPRYLFDELCVICSPFGIMAFEIGNSGMYLMYGKRRNNCATAIMARTEFTAPKSFTP